MRILVFFIALLASAWAQPYGPTLADDTGGPSDEIEREPELCPRGRLRGGIQLPANPALYRRWNLERAWGTPELIDLITLAAEEMAWLKPDNDPLVIGDMSTRRGGKLSGHRSHKGGIDVDLGLFYANGRQHLAGPTTVSPRDLDAESNWLLIRSMLETGLVERIMLDQAHINVIKRYLYRGVELTRREVWGLFPTAPVGNRCFRIHVSMSPSRPRRRIVSRCPPCRPS